LPGEASEGRARKKKAELLLSVSRRVSFRQEPRGRGGIAQKKGPRKGCVPGGQRTATLSGSDWTLVDLPLARKRSSTAAIDLVSEACRRHPCQRVRFVVRRKALLASPVQTHHMDPFYVRGVRFL